MLTLHPVSCCWNRSAEALLPDAPRQRMSRCHSIERLACFFTTFSRRIFDHAHHLPRNGKENQLSWPCPLIPPPRPLLAPTATLLIVLCAHRYLSAYLKGEYDMAQRVPKLKKQGYSDADIDRILKVRVCLRAWCTKRGPESSRA